MEESPLKIDYEIAMSIGNSLEMKTMLEDCLAVYLNRMDCSAGVVFKMQKRQDKTIVFDRAHALYRLDDAKSALQEAMKKIPVTLESAGASQFFGNLPVTGDDGRGNAYHVMELPDFGLVLLSKKGDAFDFSVIQRLKRLNEKLAVACIACSRYETLENANEFMNHEFETLKHAEDALKESENRYKSLYKMMRLMCDNVPDLIWAKDTEKRYIFTNKAICSKLLNAGDTDEPNGKTDLYFAERERKAHPQDPHWHDFGEICADTDGSVMDRKQAMRFDEFGNAVGKYLHFDVYKAPFWNEHDELIGTVGCGRDVTEEKSLQQRHEQDEKQIRESKMMLQAVFDGIQEPLILLDRDMTVKMLNKKALAYYHTEFRHSLYKKCYLAFRGRQDRCEGCDIPQIVSSGKPAGFERKSPMNPERLELVVIYPLEGEEGMGGGSILRISDITDYRMLERRLLQSEKMASLGLLVAGIAHEINNPNNFISFNLPIMREYVSELLPFADDFAASHKGFELFGMSYPEFRADIDRLLDNMEYGSSRINRIISSLSEFTRERDKMEPAWIDIVEVVKKGVTLCQGKINSMVKSFEVNIPRHLPRIFTDPGALEQVLVNLLINAAQAADKEDSRIKLNVIPPENHEGHLIIEVNDNGSGMDEKTKEKIFHPFYTTKPCNEGTGMGLYLSQMLIEGLGGTITLESAPGIGTRFSICLPATPAEKPHV